MTHKIVLGLGALAATIGSAQAAAPALHDGVFDGQTYDAYFGPVQVEITVQGGKVIDAVAVQVPDHRRTSRIINDQATPLLKREVVQAQSAKINIISGATLTSRAYISSLADALKAAQN